MACEVSFHFFKGTLFQDEILQRSPPGRHPSKVTTRATFIEVAHHQEDILPKLTAIATSIKVGHRQDDILQRSPPSRHPSECPPPGRHLPKLTAIATSIRGDNQGDIPRSAYRHRDIHLVPRTPPSTLRLGSMPVTFDRYDVCFFSQ